MKIYFTDGGATINDLSQPLNYSGFAFLCYDTEEKEITQSYTACPVGSNNQMEIRAVLEVLRRTSADEEIMIFCDSTYVLNGILEWSKKWEAKNFKDVANAELWKALNLERALKNVGYIHIKGHSSSKLNNKVDELVGFARELSKVVEKETTISLVREMTDEDFNDVINEVNKNIAKMRKYEE